MADDRKQVVEWLDEIGIIVSNEDSCENNNEPNVRKVDIEFAEKKLQTNNPKAA